MNFEGLMVGFAMTGSFCTFKSVIPQIQRLKQLGANIVPIMSHAASTIDTRFGSSEYFRTTLEEICGRPIICTIKDAEPIGPKKLIDVLIIAPCTSNTLAKLYYGINDSSVTMAAKSHLRNSRPLLIAVSTNDALSNSAKNIGGLLNAKNIYFVPYGQDDPIKKPHSMVAHMELIPDCLQAALDGQQLQPIVR